LELFRSGALAAATLTTGLMAGLYYAYAISVMLGLSMTDHRTFVSVMQQINVAILNPWFFVSFFGALVFTALAGVLHLPGDWRVVLPWIVAALILYVATLVITFGFNVPLNNELAAAGNPDRIADLAAAGGIIPSSVATRYQLCLLRHAASLTVPLRASTPHGTCESAMNAPSSALKSPANEAGIFSRSRNRKPS
jgi:uncharacterized membrane protein